MGGNCSCLFRKEPSGEKVAQAPSELRKKRQAQEQKSTDTLETLEGTPRAIEKQVETLQAYIRSYLARKRFIFPDKSAKATPGGPAFLSDLESATDVSEMPEGLLTQQVRQKLKKVGPYVFRLKAIAGERLKPKKLADGNYYFGEWRDGRRYGRGLLYTSTGGLMEGYWDEVLHLDGRIILPSGEFYEGGFWFGLKQGYGRFEDEAAVVYYEGEWLYDKRHGLGIERTAESEYEGSFRNDEKSGNGTLQWMDGEKYEGEFASNLIHGVGKYVWTETKWYQGTWQRNKMHGRGKFVNGDSEYEGEFVRDKKEGKGIFRWAGNLYEGEWRDGKMHGLGYLTMEGKRRSLFYFENNRRIGPRIKDRRSEPMRATL